jgi:hypothetical protein
MDGSLGSLIIGVWKRMAPTSALPFFLRRSHDVYGGLEFTTTTERIHGLLRLDGERLIVQWRIARETERYGPEIRTDHEVEPVREVILPLSALSGVAVREHRWRWPWGPQLVLTASDLRAFEDIAGAAGLRLAHPATLVLRIQRSERLAAQEFAADVNLAVADQALLSTKAPLPFQPDRAAESPQIPGPPDPLGARRPGT